MLLQIAGQPGEHQPVTTRSYAMYKAAGASEQNVLAPSDCENFTPPGFVGQAFAHLRHDLARLVWKIRSLSAPRLVANCPTELAQFAVRRLGCVPSQRRILRSEWDDGRLSLGN